MSLSPKFTTLENDGPIERMLGGRMDESPGRILLADDDTLFRKATRRVLESHGHVVDEVADMVAALALLETNIYDLVVANVDMPGNEELALLRSSLVPVLVVTSAPSIEGAVAALRGAAVDYLTKPFASAQLLECVDAGIARGRALRVLDEAEQHLHERLDLLAVLRTALQVSGAGQPREQVALPLGLDDRLSQREKEVLAAFRATPRVSVVAKQLYISPHTVKNHLKAIFRKLGVNSQTELIAKLEQMRGEL